MARQSSRETAPTKEQIADFHDEVEDLCWACYVRQVERAHVVPHALEGHNHPSNFALLCPACHALAPDTADATFFWAWLDRQRSTFVSRMAAQYGDLTGRSFEVDARLAMIQSEGFRVQFEAFMRRNRSRYGVHTNHFSWSTRLKMLADFVPELVGFPASELPESATVSPS